MNITLFINDNEHRLDVLPDEFLYETLRKAGYPSVRWGCKVGTCGSCTIWMNDQPVLACSVLSVRADGQRITTIEGIQGEAAQLAEYIAAEGVDQCGFCSPGLVMLALAMRRDLQNPTHDEIKEYCKGNLCRCSGYEGKTRAIEKWLQSKPWEAAR